MAYGVLQKMPESKYPKIVRDEFIMLGKQVK